MLHPGSVALVDWRRVYFGTEVSLDQDCRASIEAGARTIETIVAKGYGPHAVARRTFCCVC